MRIGIVAKGCIFSSGTGSEKLFSSLAQGTIETERRQSLKGDFQINAPFETGGEVIKEILGRKRYRYFDPQMFYALFSTKMCLESCPGDLSTIEREQMGIISAINLPQVRFGAEQVRKTVMNEMISIYAGLAFYFGALVGETAMEFGYQGEGLAMLTDFCSVIDGCGQACQMFGEKDLKAALLISAEAPVYDFSFYTLRNLGYYAKAEYVPYSRQSRGFRIGEGGLTLLLGDLDYFSRLNSENGIMASILSYTSLNSYHRYWGHRRSWRETLEQVITKCLERAGVKPAEVDLFLGNAWGIPTLDEDELEILNKIFTGGILKITSSKQVTGILGATSSGADMILALECMKNNLIPPIAHLHRRDVPKRFHHLLTFEKVQRNIQKVLVLSSSLGAGKISAVLLQKEGFVKTNERPNH